MALSLAMLRGARAQVPAAPRKIEEVVVTAQKKEQLLHEVPISISTFGGEQLRDSAIEDLHDLAEHTPDLRFTTNPCCMTVFIRGFGTPFALSAFDPTVGVVLDDLLIPRETYMADPLYDIERIELLRGPQGTLFGKNTPAGLFNVISARPTEGYSGFALGRVGGLGIYRAEAAIGGPLPGFGTGIRFRLAGVASRGAGDVENTKLGVDEPAAEQRGGRLSLAFDPLDGLSILVIASAATTEARLHTQLEDLRESSLQFLRRFDPRVEDDGFDHQNSVNLSRGLSRKTRLAQTNLRYALERWTSIRDAELVAILGYTDFDADRSLDLDFSPADVLNLGPHADFRYGQLSAEMRFSGAFDAPLGLGNVEMLTGGLVLEADLRSVSPLRAGADFDEYLLSAPAFELLTGMPSPGGLGFEDLDAVTAALGREPLADVGVLEGDGGRLLLDQKTKSDSLFGNVVWHPTERWALAAGARVTFESKQAHLINHCSDLGLVCTILGVQEFDRRPDRNETDFSPKVTLQYFPFEALSLFATRATGFKSGGFNNLSFTGSDLEVQPERTVSWEVGARGSIFSRALSYAATLFEMDVDDLQLQSLTGGQVQVRNAASAHSRGLEIDAQWLTPWRPLSVRGGGAFIDARFEDFRNAPAIASSGASTQDLSGRRMPYVPKVQLMVTPELSFPLGAHDLVWKAAVDVLYRSSEFLDVDLDPRTRQSGYAMLDARMGLSSSGDSWLVGVGVKNVTDADVLEFATDSIAFPQGFTVLQEFQRTYFFEARYAW